MSLTIKEVMPENYGYVVLVVAGGSLVNFWHFKQLHAARTQYDVKPPAMSSEEHPEFNCIMRAHQNYLEFYPFWAATTIFGGLEYPRVVAGAGLAFLVGRIIYAKDYAKDPAKRGRGFMLSGLASMVALGATVGFGKSLLGCTMKTMQFWKK